MLSWYSLLQHAHHSDSAAPHYNLAYNLAEWLDSDKIIQRQQHHTPLYTTSALQFRDEVIATNGERHTYHAGAYLTMGCTKGLLAQD